MDSPVDEEQYEQKPVRDYSSALGSPRAPAVQKMNDTDEETPVAKRQKPTTTGPQSSTTQTSSRVPTTSFSWERDPNGRRFDLFEDLLISVTDNSL